MGRFILFLFTNLIFGVTYAQHNICSHKNHAVSLRNNTENMRSDTIDVLNYTIQLDVTDFTNQLISGFCTVTFVPKMNNINSISLDLLKMTVDSVKIGNSHLSYSYNDTLLISFFPSALGIADTTHITIYYQGNPQKDPSNWGGFYFQGNYAFNLGVGFASKPHNFGRVWHPCFDNFIERATYEITLITGNGKTAYANGYLLNEQTQGSNLIRTWKMETPIPTYLACLAVGNYTHVNQNYYSSLTSNNIPIMLIAQPGDTTNFKNSFINLGNAMQGFENAFGPYIWNKVGFVLVPFSSGAMEHATCIAYPLVAANGSLTYETLMAHELSHHWWGDLVTCKTAEDMWINEGFAAYCEKLFLEYQYGPSAYFNEVRKNHKQVLWKAHVDDGAYYPLSGVPHSVTYGSTTYDKGADVVHTLRSYMGDSTFFAAMKIILANNQLNNIDANDFLTQLNALPGINLTDFWNGWILNPGFPHFSVDSFRVNNAGGYFTTQVYVKQKLRGAPAYFNNVPMQVVLRGANWEYKDTTVMLSGANTAFYVNTGFQPVYVALNENEKISDAVTAQNVIVKNTGSVNHSHANFILNTQQVTDSVFLRIEHNWVGADTFTVNQSVYIISPDRYWNIQGIDMHKLTAKARLNFNGTTSGSGWLDNGLMQNYGSFTFTEDSLILFYRANASQPWSIHPYYTLNTQSNSTNKVGQIEIDSLWPGQYAFGLRIAPLSIYENTKNKNTVKIFPNPAKDIVTVDLQKWNYGNNQLEIFNSNGTLVHTQFLGNLKKAEIYLSHLASGLYYLRIKNEKTSHTEKFVLR